VSDIQIKKSVKLRSRYTTTPTGTKNESGRKKLGLLRDANQDGIMGTAYNEFK
jgi:hypothetical protein